VLADLCKYQAGWRQESAGLYRLDPRNDAVSGGTVAVVDRGWRETGLVTAHRAASVFAGFRFPREVISVAVRWYLRYGLSYRDVEELLAERGVTVDHVTVYRWVQRFTFADLAAGFGVGTATARRYVTETVRLLAARAPKLGPALRAAKQAGHAFVVIDGTLIAIDRVAKDGPFYSGKHRRHGMNLQSHLIPGPTVLWVSGPLPGSVHDLTAARICGVVRALAAAGLITLADKGYHGAGQHVLTPYKGRGKPGSQKAANSAHARLRGPGERANAQLKSWHILRKLRCCPWKAGLIAKAIHVLQAREIGG
jgi:hypothetical protein